jgi:hypothetical protein
MKKKTLFLTSESRSPTKTDPKADKDLCAYRTRNPPEVSAHSERKSPRGYSESKKTELTQSIFEQKEPEDKKQKAEHSHEILVGPLT